MWRHLSATAAERFSTLQHAADFAYFGSEERLVERAPLLAARAVQAAQAGETPKILHERWWAAVGDYLTFLRELAAEGRLIGTPEDVAVSQLHMLHNRMGWSAGNEVYLVWLASFTQARNTVRAGYHTDSALAPDRRYHEHSKYHFAPFGDTQAPHWRTAQVPEPRFGTGEPIVLPQPMELARPLGEVLLARRSEREGLDGRLRLAEFATLLGGAFGAVVRPYRLPDGNDHVVAGRVYPSPGMAYCTRVRVLVYEVEGLDPGLYEYMPLEHALAFLAPAPGRDTFAYASSFFVNDAPRIDPVEVPAMLFIGADISDMRLRYGLRTYRFALLELGHAAHTVSLVAACLGLKHTLIGGFFDDAACALAQLDGHDEILAYLMPVGARQPSTPQ
jgi:SagB-type dehydrogenase family enzyme